MYRRAIRRKSRLHSAAPPQQAPVGVMGSPAWSLANIPARSGHGVCVQPKLVVGAANDPAEQAADRAADQVMAMNEGDGPVAVAASTGGIRREASGNAAGGAASGAAQSAIGSLGGGMPIPVGERAFFEPRFGRDLSDVRIHDGGAADGASRSIAARAFTLGNDIAFARGEYRPGTDEGRRLMAHELAHVMQQDGEGGVIRRVSRDQCAPECVAASGSGAEKGKFQLTIMSDKEGPFLLIPATSNVGHAWLRLQDDQGNYWTYGFWPAEGFDPDNATQSVEGCVHHPDTAHDHHITGSQTYDLTADQFAAALAYARSTCAKQPAYNLFSYNCTTFVRETLDAAGQGPAGGFGLIWDSPNSLDQWLRMHALQIGAGATVASDDPGGAAKGSFSLQASYRQQFFSTLGNKLRLYGVGQGELGFSGGVNTVGAGVGVGFDPQRVWLPSIYAEGMGAMGDMSAGQDRFGAGVSLGYGLDYKIDAFGSIGIEHNVLKDFVADDPMLNRLMIKAKINLW